VTSTTPATEEEGGDLCMVDPRSMSDPQTVEAGGGGGGGQGGGAPHRGENLGTSWEAEVVADHRDVDEFMEGLG
jgi:hypothetical protein